MNIESATGTFVFTLVFEKYTKQNIFQTLNAFFLERKIGSPSFSQYDLEHAKRVKLQLFWTP